MGGFNGWLHITSLSLEHYKRMQAHIVKHHTKIFYRPLALSSKLTIFTTVLFTKLLANYSAVSLVFSDQVNKRLAKWLDSPLVLNPPSLPTTLLGINQCHLVT